MQTYSNSIDSTPVRLGQSHGYRIENDTVAINADLTVANDVAGSQAQWALQLWACDAPYAGGLLSGIKVAEAPVTLYELPEAQPLRFDAQTAACLPGGQREYSMVLVLAAGQPGAFLVHDFANYPAREHFAGPKLAGSVSYVIDGSEVTVRAERVSNTRPVDNLSGSLVLELWAQSMTADDVARHVTCLAQVQLGRLSGQTSLEAIEQRVPFQIPSRGDWKLSLLLREWTAHASYITRDACDFAVAYAAAPLAPVVEAFRPVEGVPAVQAAVNAAAPTQVAEPFQAPEAAEPTEASKASKGKKARDGARASARRAPAAANAIDSDQRISITQASVEELSALEGLSRKVALEIVKSRPFASIDELVRVRGIGPRMLQNLRGRLKL
ncbi:MAG: helix-hairpin-helix domain-containing protein [Myxococcales bacterium]